jgi:PAS domain S-box-containing protein
MGVKKGDESRAWILINSNPVFEEDNKTLKNVLVAFADITELVNLGIKLKHREEQLQQIIEFLPHPLILFDKDFSITYTNSKMDETLGYTLKDVLHVGAADFFKNYIKSDVKDIEAILNRNKLSSSGLLENFSCYSKAGQKLFINLIMSEVEEEEGITYICILQDVTSRTQYQQKVEQQNKVLNEIAWQQSHVLRKPVANIIGLCDMLTIASQPHNAMELTVVEHLKQAAQELDTAIKTIVNQSNT